MRAALVILNWNTCSYLREFLPGLLASCRYTGCDRDGKPVAEVVVVDNASDDGSLDMLASEFPFVKTIALDRNYGFTGGYDRGLEKIEADYYVLINSDIDVPQDWLAPLIEWMDGHPDCGVCGPKLHSLVKDTEGGYVRSDSFEYAGAAGGYIDMFGYPFCRGRVMKRTEKDEGQYDRPHDVLWVSGACLMVRSSVWKALGGLDDRFFAHMEEIDLCWRANLSGWKVTVVPDSVVYHLGGGTLPADSPWKLELNYRNNLLLLDNNARSRGQVFARMVLDGCSAAVYLVSGKTEYFKAVISAHKAFRILRKEGCRKEATGNGGALPHECGARVSGSWTNMRKLCILPLAAIKGEKIFKFLKRYEDCH